jgi:hypothetical protein
MMNWAVSERKRSWPNFMVLKAVTWKDWGKSQKTSVRIAGLRVKIRTRNFSNTKQECFPLDHDIRYQLWGTGINGRMILNSILLCQGTMDVDIFTRLRGRSNYGLCEHHNETSGFINAGIFFGQQSNYQPCKMYWRLRYSLSSLNVSPTY